MHKNLAQVVQIFPKNDLIACSSKLVSPICQYLYTDMSVISVTFANSEEEKELLHIQMFVVELLSKCPSGKVSPTNRSHKTNKSDKLSL